MNQVRASKISFAFGYQLINHLGKYMGVPLNHKRLSRHSFSWVTNKLMRLVG